MKKTIPNTIFISRKPGEGSPFLTHLVAAGFEVHGESLVSFTRVPFHLKETPDWVFFYSQHAVRFFFEQEGTKQLISSARLACIGPGTATALKNYCAEIDFIGKGSPEAVAADFGPRAKGQSVLFPRAKQSKRSVQQLLEGKIEASELVVYDNQKRSDFVLPFCATLVFTSPMNAEAYNDKYPISEKQRVLAIGNVTARRLQKMGVIQVEIAAEPTEESLAELILQ